MANVEYVEDGMPVLAADTLHAYYYGVGVYKFGDPGQMTGAAEIIGSNYKVSTHDFQLLVRYPREENSLNDGKPVRKLLLFGVWSYFSHTAQYCAHCVDLEQFKKWRSKIQKSEQQLIAGAVHSTKAIGDNTHALTLVADQIDKIKVGLDNTQANMRVSENNFRYWKSMEARVNLMKAGLDAAAEAYEAGHLMVQNLLLDAIGPGSPTLSRGLLSAAITQAEGGSNIQQGFVEGSIRIFIDSQNLYVSYRSRPDEREDDRKMRVLQTDLCWWKDAETWTFVRDAAAIMPAGGKQFGAFLPFLGDALVCDAPDCVVNGVNYRIGNWFQKSSDGRFYQLVGDLSPIMTDAISRKSGFIRHRGHLMAFCTGTCELITTSTIVARRTLKDEIVPVQSCRDCSYELESESIVYFEKLNYDMSTIGDPPVLPGLPEVKFMESHSPVLGGVTLSTEAIRAELHASNVSRAKGARFIEAANRYLEEAEAQNFTANGVPIDLGDIIGKTVGAIAGGAVKLVEGLGNVVKGILSSTILMLLPYILSGCALGVAIFFPLLLNSGIGRGIIAPGQPLA
jgi:hypothetical protein